MKLPVNMSTLLGKKPKSNEATFGQPLDLGQLAIDDSHQIHDPQESIETGTAETPTAVIDSQPAPSIFRPRLYGRTFDRG